MFKEYDLAPGTHLPSRSYLEATINEGKAINEKMKEAINKNQVIFQVNADIYRENNLRYYLNEIFGDVITEHLALNNTMTLIYFDVQNSTAYIITRDVNLKTILEDEKVIDYDKMIDTTKQLLKAGIKFHFG